METKYTPGPWDKVLLNDCLYIRDFDDRAICAMYDDHYGTGEHNANLIAAAPELLEACEAALRLVCEHIGINPGDPGSLHCEILKKAIAKARGEQ